MILYLTEAAARARLERAVKGTPALVVADVDILMVIARVEEPTLEQPLPGYDIEKAAAVGWEWRAGQLAEQRSVGAEGAKAENQQKFAHAMEMVRYYRVSGAVLSTGKFRRTDVIR